MEPKLKREILDKIKINELINNILKSEKRIDEQILKKIAEIINLIGTFIIENFDYTKELIKSNNNEGNDDINNSYNWSCNELRYYFYFFKEISLFNNQINYEESYELSDSLNSIIIYFKSNDIILNKSNYVLDAFKEIFPLIENILKIPNEYSLDNDIDELDKDDDFFKCRGEFSNIYKNTYYIEILKEFIIDSVLNNLYNLLKIQNEQNINNININSINNYDVEFCLYLIKILQECITKEDFLGKNIISQKLSKIYTILFTYPFTKIKKADYVFLSYYNTINRGLENIKNNKNAIEYIINLYISDEGIFYNGQNFCIIKIITYFDRFLTKIKSNIQKLENMNFINIANSIKNSLYKLIIAIKSSQNYILLKNYKLLFHSYGIIINLEKNKKNLYEEALKLLTNIFNELNTNNIQINQGICELILDCIIQFIQTVSVKNDVEIKKLFIEYFNNFIGSYCIKIIDNKNSSLLLKYINFMQSILILLGVDSIDYLNYFFLNNNYLNINVISDYLKLVFNTITSLKSDSIILIKKSFNNFYLFISNINFPNDNISDENKIYIDIFSEFNRLFWIICNNIPEVFFQIGGIDNLNFINLLEFILIIGNKFNEFAQRRRTIVAIKSLCKYFNKNKNIFNNNQDFIKIIELIFDHLFLFYKKNDKKNLLDWSSLAVEIANCHFLLLDYDIIYYNYLNKYLSQNEIEQFINIIKNVDYKKLKASQELINAFDHIVNKIS